MRGKNNFKLNDVKRAIQSVTRAGLAIENVEITKDGTIRLVTGKGEAPIQKNPWDDVDAADQKRPA